MHSRTVVARNRRRYYVTSMATVLSAILFSAGLSSSWFSLVPRSMEEAPDTLGTCRLVEVESFKAAGMRGMWRPDRAGAARVDGTLRQMLFPMRT